MLQQFRSNSNSIFIYLIFGAIIVTFIFAFGTQPESCSVSSSEDIVRVGGHRIDRVEFANLMRLSQGRFNRIGYEFNTQSPEVRLTAATNIGLVLYISDLAEEAGLRVSDDELAAYIQGELQCNPDTILYVSGGQIDRRLTDRAYQGLGRWPELRSCIIGGKFDDQAYQRMLDDYNLSPIRYESYKRRELLALNYLTLLDQSVVTPDHEVRRVFDDNSTVISLRYARVTSASVAHLITAPDDAAIDAFLQSRAPEVQAYYDANKGEYNKPGRVELSVIAVQKQLPESLPLTAAGQPLDRDMTAEARFSVVKDKVLNQKLPFEEVALLHNETTIESYYKQRGRAGWSDFPSGVSENRQLALQDAKPGDIVEVEEKEYFSLVRLEAREAPIKRELADVQRDIARLLIERERLAQKRDEVARDIFALAKGGAPLQQAIDEVMGYAAMIDPASLPAPSPGEPPAPAPPLEPSPEPSPGEPPAPAPAAEDTPPAPAPALAPAAAPFVPEGQRLRAEESRPATPRALPMLPPEYSQAADPFGVGPSRALLRDVVALKEAGQVAPQVYPMEDAQLVVTLARREVGDEALFNQQRPMIAESLRRAQVQMLIGRWYQVIDLRHETPASAPAPYGAWLAAVYEEASNKRMRLHPSLIDAVKKSREGTTPDT